MIPLVSLPRKASLSIVGGRIRPSSLLLRAVVREPEWNHVVGTDRRRRRGRTHDDRRSFGVLEQGAAVELVISHRWLHRARHDQKFAQTLGLRTGRRDRLP